MSSISAGTGLGSGSGSDFNQVMDILNKKNDLYEISEVNFIIDSCVNNPDFVKMIGTQRIFDLCDSLITNGRFSEFKDLILKIVSLDPEIFYLVDTIGYNIFMMALEYTFNIEECHFIEFLKSLIKLLNDYRLDRLENHQELRLFNWDIENSVSNPTITMGEKDEYPDDDDRRTILALAIETGNFSIVETCFFMGCHKIMPDDEDEPLEACILAKNLIETCLDNQDFDPVMIDNFGMKINILLCIQLFKEHGIGGDFIASLGADLVEFIM